MSRAGVERARAEARRLHVELGTREPGHIDPMVTARALGIEVAYGNLPGATARIFRIGREAARIRVSDAIVHPGRLRFSIAHELGHFVLGHSVPGVEGDYRDDDVEREADAFAVEHLTPEAMVRAHCQLSPVDLRRTRAIAERFQTSPVAAALRLVELSRERCAAVYCEHGRVKWSRPSRTFRYRIPHSWQPPAPSVTRDLCTTATVPLEARSVPARTWIPYVRDEHATVIEHAELVPEPGWGGVLSLLWIPACGSDHRATDYTPS